MLAGPQPPAAPGARRFRRWPGCSLRCSKPHTVRLSQGLRPQADELLLVHLVQVGAGCGQLCLPGWLRVAQCSKETGLFLVHARIRQSPAGAVAAAVAPPRKLPHWGNLHTGKASTCFQSLSGWAHSVCNADQDLTA